MRTTVKLTTQRGALSLLWCAILAGAVAAIGMAALMSMRHERNLFQDGWANLMASAVVKSVKTLDQDVRSGTPAGKEIRRCTVDGKVMYSNIDCGPDRPASRDVVLHDSRGIEPPKPAPATAPDEAPPSMQDRMMEKALQDKMTPR
ncbi:MAG TPA: hypothetical protein VGU61_14870 [Noviherbaspirillum sp.]|uniref:hypothetical protein n=1 Tax=Noviherbaspirillum sp. TaxID=1926288 RepID=UPI002DDD8004|nr:hypothetical protein [Noviherbaspirillum sp.]HEV2611549.1 hypothetical protein [Noviherbaspirillum sp.]